MSTPTRPTGELRDILQRERSRADRTGSEFSMLRFRPRDKSSQTARGKPRSTALSAVTRVLGRRSRSIDDVGQSRDRYVWLVMPNCSAESAGKVGREICQTLASDGLAFMHEVYHHSPSVRERDQNAPPPGQDDRRHDSALPRKRDWAGGQDTPIKTVPTGNGVQAFHDADITSPMRELFLIGAPLWKRCLDILGSMVGLIILGIMVLPIAVATKISSGGPVFFRQLRSGRGGRAFSMVKFRTMVADAGARKAELMPLNEQDGPAFKIENDPRVTTVGRFLRSTSLDELPQFWNVFRGQMSLVGPRPLPCAESEACRDWQLERLDALPGLTGSWQVKDRRSKVSFADWMRMDIRYIRSQSLLLDAKLILRTVTNVARRRGC